MNEARRLAHSLNTEHNRSKGRYVWYIVYICELNVYGVASQSDMRSGAFEEWEVVETCGDMPCQ